MADDVTDSIIEMAKEKGEIDTGVIKENVLDKLERSESAIVESWKKFDKKYKS